MAMRKESVSTRRAKKENTGRKSDASVRQGVVASRRGCCARDCGAIRAARGRAILSRAPGPDRHSLRRRRPQRPDRAAARGKDVGSARPAVRDRKQGRRRRLARHGVRGKGAARRLHAADDDRLVHRQRRDQRQSDLQSGHRLRADNAAGAVLRHRADDAAGLSGQDAARNLSRSPGKIRASTATAMPASATSLTWRRSCFRSSPASSCSRFHTGARPRSRPTSCPATSMSASCRL